jgi:hypothetical protein
MTFKCCHAKQIPRQTARYADSFRSRVCANWRITYSHTRPHNCFATKRIGIIFRRSSPNRLRYRLFRISNRRLTNNRLSCSGINYDYIAWSLRTTWIDWEKPKCINIKKRAIFGIGINIDTTAQPNRIGSASTYLPIPGS